MIDVVTIGVDPGPSSGICVLDGGPGFLIQTDAVSVMPMTRILIAGYAGRTIRLAVEEFVIGPNSAKAKQAGKVTRDLIGALTALTAADNVWMVKRSAAEVKPWATDHRLKAAGLYDRGVGIPHARDGARHALYSAVRDAGMTDPLI